jgi:CRP-like cAMP-binding protein
MDSCPSHDDVGGFSFDFEAIRRPRCSAQAPKKAAVYKAPLVREAIARCLSSNPLFKRCRPEEKEELLGQFEKVQFTKGSTIIKQGDEGATFYVVEDGVCDAFIKGTSKAVASPGPGSGFGELALMYNTPRAATIVARTPVILWKIERSEYRLVLASHAKQRSDEYKALLAEVELINSEGTKKRPLKHCITDQQMTKLADAMDEDVVPAGQNVIVQGDEGHTFFVIADGDVDVYVDNSKVNTLGRGRYFGEVALIRDDKRNATITAGRTGAKVLAVDREDFVALLGDIDALISSGSSEEVEVDLTKRDAAQIGLKDLTVIRTLGHGAFGTVALACHEASGRHYALKSQAKHAICENNLQEHVLMEREILMMLDHPFILKLVCAFQDDYDVYFLLELLIGGELFSHLRRAGRFDEPSAKFYAAGVVLAFEHMHAKKVAYRDLKPENLVLDNRGYVKLVDLGLAKVVPGKTWTLCGTPDYLAPEVILNEGHDKAVDYWALGVLIYELVAGVPPFYADDPMDVYEKILSANMAFPSHFGRYLNDVVRKLLKLCQSKRLGNGRQGVGAIKKHRWFSGFGWDDLLEGKLKPPVDVKVQNDGDAHNFDTYDEQKSERVARRSWRPALDD